MPCTAVSATLPVVSRPCSSFSNASRPVKCGLRRWGTFHTGGRRCVRPAAASPGGGDGPPKAGAEALDDLADTARDIGEGFVLVGPGRHGLAVLGQRLQLGEGRAPPIHRSENHRDDPGVAGVVALQRAGHLQVVAVVGGEEVGADEKEDDGRAVQMRVDFAGPLIARADLAVVPRVDDALALEQAEVGPSRSRSASSLWL